MAHPITTSSFLYEAFPQSYKRNFLVAVEGKSTVLSTQFQKFKAWEILRGNILIKKKKKKMKWLN